MIKFNTSLSNANCPVNRIEESIIMVILITLFAIKIVASNNDGLLISFKIVLWEFKFDSFKLFLSDGVRAKKAISEPEINPEQKSKKTQDKSGSKKLIISVFKIYLH